MVNCFKEDVDIATRTLKDFKELNDSRFLVTGATGLIGSAIICILVELNRKYKLNISVFAAIRNENKAKNIFKDIYSEIHFISIDFLKDEIPDIEIDYIIHCASSTVSKHYVSKPVETLLTTTKGIEKILEFSKNKNIKSGVFLSSMEVYGVVDYDTRRNEKELGYIDLNSVRSSYSESKRLAELMVYCYAKEFDVNFKTARLAQTFGAGAPENDNRVFMQIARSIINDKDFVMHSDGTSLGNYIYTRDAIIGIFTILFRGEIGEIYNLVNESTSTTIKDMVESLFKEFNSSAKIIYEIPDSTLTYGYAPNVKLKLSSKKLNQLGWSAQVGLLEAYERLIFDMKLKDGEKNEK